MLKPEKLTPKEINKMAEIMALAFVQHENWVFTIKKEKKRLKALKHIFNMMFKVINEYGYIFVVRDKEEEIGYITYMDVSSKSDISVYRVIKTKGFFDFIKFLYSINPISLKKFINYMKAYNAHTNDTVNKTIHLYSTGITEAHRGKGIMGKSFRESFSYFFQKGYKKVVLETSDKSNIAVYQKVGFKLEEVIIKKNNTLYFFELEQQVNL